MKQQEPQCNLLEYYLHIKKNLAKWVQSLMTVSKIGKFFQCTNIWGDFWKDLWRWMAVMGADVQGAERAWDQNEEAV